MRVFTDPKEDPWTGTLVDVGHWYAMNDKLQHLLYGIFATLLLQRWTPWGWAMIALVVLGVAILWEVLELVRKALGSTLFADYISYRDIVASVIGILAALLLL